MFGAHFAPAVDALFTEAARVGLRVTSGLVVSDRLLRDDLLTTPQRAYDEGLRAGAALARGRPQPVRRDPAVLASPAPTRCSTRARRCSPTFRASWFTSHVNENPREIAARGYACSPPTHYVDAYDRHGLVGPRTVLAHNVHPTDDELKLLATRDAAIAHCPTSNCALGSGLFPLSVTSRQACASRSARDVGAGTGFSLFKEALQAYFVQQLLGDQGLPLAARTPAPPRDRGGRRAYSVCTMSATSARQAVRRALAAPPPRDDAGRRAARRHRPG